MGTDESDDLPFIIIDRAGTGSTFLYFYNSNRVKCLACRKIIKAREGYKFRPERYASEKKGFLCHTCIADIFRSIPEWSYNPLTYHLWKADYRTTKPIPGETLAMAWIGGGMGSVHRACLKLIKEIRNEPATNANAPA